MTRALSRAKAQKPSGEQKTPERPRPAARAPRELREVLASPGHPVDPGVRRELESRLGHDFSRVRVHHDQDSAAMTALLGADAVTVGQDIFFARDTFRPETTDGRRLLVHELLHTVQAPVAFGALRAGRDSGAVSLPQEPVEQEAERIARSERPEQPVERARAGASWLRYATVDADRMRTEQLDPAALVDRLVAGVLRSLRGDPEDVSGRVRGQLSRFTPELRETVLIRLETRLPSSEYARVLEILVEADREAAGGPVDTPGVPEPVGEEEPAPEQEPGEQEPPSEQEPDEEPAEQEPGTEEPGTEEPGAGETPEEEPQQEPSPEEAEEKPEEAEAEEPEEDEKEKEDGEEKGEEDEAAEEAGAEAAQQPLARAPGAPGAPPAAGGAPAAGATPATGGAGVAEPTPAGPEQVEQAERAPESPLAQHGLLDRDDREDTEPEQEQPIGLEPGADAEVDVPEPEERAPEEEGRPERPPLTPADFLPSTDLDVSNVPTADQLTLPSSGAPPSPPSAPSFPAPPPTRAEQEETEEAEPADAAPEPVAPATPVEEEVPAEQPLAAEVGPEPGAESAAPVAEPVGADPVDTRAPGAVTAPEPVSPETASPGPTTGGLMPAGGLPGAGAPAGDPAGAGPEAAPEQVENGPAPAPEASLEPGGGGCGGPPAPTAGEGAGGAGCGAGGGGGAGAPAAAAEPQVAPPDVSSQPPEAALATVSTLPPDRMQTSLAGVDAAVSRDVGEQQSALAAAPPTTERPSGAPQTLSGPPRAAPPGDAQKITLERTAAESAERQERAQAERIEGQNRANAAPRPHVAGDAQGNLSPDEIENVQQAVANVPTTDPALNTTVGPAPEVELAGETDPVRTDQQAGELQQATGTMHETGVQEAAKPLGEDQIFPDVPAETLTAQVPGGEGGGGATAGPLPGAGGPGGADAGVAVVAQQERGPQIQAGVEQGGTQMGVERQTQQQGAEQANAQHDAEVAATVQENAAAQTAERGKVAADVAAKREEWRTEQNTKVEESNAEAGAEHEKARTGISDEKTETDREVEQQKQEDDDRIVRERRAAEEKAREEKEAKQRESESGGFFSWIASKVTSFFNALLDAITDIFNAAVALVNDIVRGFASIVTGLIDLARDAIVGLIDALANVLLALCDVLAVFFPELAARMREAIETTRDAAIAAVNELADELKAGVEFLLNKLAEALTGLLRLLEAGLKAAVEVVRGAVNAAIEFAKAAIQMLGEFAAIVADIASMGVGAWLGRLGSSAKEGIQNHLWGAIKTAVRQWFDEKVEAVVGLGKTVIDVLVKGCISMAQIGKMVWDSVVAALPTIIVAVVVERVVSLIVPAAGAVLAVVQGLMAAWGSVSKILGAISAFIAFARAVKAGPAACLFAAAVAAGVVALLEFITNFLMAKLAMAAKGVGRALKGMAAKIKNGLARAGRGVRRGAGNAVNAARRGLRGASRALRPPGGRPGPRRRPGGPVAGTRGRPSTPDRRAPDRRTPSQRAADRRTAPRGPDRPSPLNRARTAVRDGVRRVATTLRRVGKRIANSGLGRSLRNTAKKLRDRYQRARDRWRAKQRQRAENRRRRDEERNSPESKQRRLDLIVAKIKPKVQRLLSRGTGSRIHTAALAAWRLFYRLSRLVRTSGTSFGDRAQLNPEKLVVNGVSLDSEPLLKFIRDVEKDILAQRDARIQGQQLATTQTATGATQTTIPANEDIATAGGLLTPQLGKPFQRNVINLEGAGGGQVSSRMLSSYGQPGGFFLEKMNNAGLTGEGGRYSDSERRILGSGTMTQTSRALAVFQQSRATNFGADPGEIALLGMLAHDTEPRRNPGTRVFSILISDLYAEVPGQGNRKLQTQKFLRAFRMHPMAPEGSSSAATVLNKFLAKRPGALDAAVERRVQALRRNGAPPELLVGNLRDLPQWQRRVHMVRSANKDVEQATKRIERARGSADPTVQRAAQAQLRAAQSRLAKWNTREFRSLQLLQKQQDAQNLANREVRTLQAWFNTVTPIDSDSQGNAEKTLNELKRRIVERMQSEFPWWTPNVRFKS
ncbi:eCIS core domain-containing protein [Umezawaea beigongshangensis]|uniref:eCIS core domain-containing protein n=1 Tax=Umezawaea beigongshangensis TaxID=2780383 RepID=UPI0018F16F1B|nr:DUF4157 domain-containing protein [Umezawaea beigongshangensis]